jgi:hypothetical protein
MAGDHTGDRTAIPWHVHNPACHRDPHDRHRDTRNARMEARYTLPDIIQACHEGYVSHGTLSIDDCIQRYRLLTDWPPLHATADCVAGFVNVEGERTVLPAHPDCASGGFRAIAAFKTLCPSYGSEVLGERSSPRLSPIGRGQISHVNKANCCLAGANKCSQLPKRFSPSAPRIHYSYFVLIISDILFFLDQLRLR